MMNRKRMIGSMLCAIAAAGLAACGGGGKDNGPDTSPPSVPTNVVSLATSTNRIAVSWSPSSDNVGVAGYRVFKVTDLASKTTTTLLGRTASTSIAESGLTQSTYHCYQVSAYDSAGNESAKSSVSCGTTNQEFYIIPDTGQDPVTIITDTRPIVYTGPSGTGGTVVSYPVYTTTDGSGQPIIYQNYTILDSSLTDSWTGLTWQQESDNRPRTWAEANEYCSNLPLANSTEWRLPTRRELLSVVHYARSRPDPAMDPLFMFAPDSYLASLINRYEYWSVTPFAGNTTQAWTIDFWDGVANYRPKSLTRYVRCVKGGQLPAQRLKDNGDGTLTDDATGLMWHKLITAPTLSWDDALSTCATSTLAGGGWRLPNIRELESIVDVARFDPAMQGSPYFTDSKSDLIRVYWSSTSIFNISGTAWGLYFWDGEIPTLNMDKFRNGAVRCVRNVH